MYEGEWRADRAEGRGAFHYAGGKAEIGTYKNGKDVGEGLRWSTDREKVWRLHEGELQEAVSQREAQKIAKRIGLPVPP